MKNIPRKIYLQIGEDAELAADFNELSREDITWCEDKINDNDIEYTRIARKEQRAKEAPVELFEKLWQQESKGELFKGIDKIKAKAWMWTGWRFAHKNKEDTE